MKTQKNIKKYETFEPKAQKLDLKVQKLDLKVKNMIWKTENSIFRHFSLVELAGFAPKKNCEIFRHFNFPWITVSGDG